MTVQTSHECRQWEVTDALARDELRGAERRAAQQHLEECESCRTRFRLATTDRFPRLRNYTVLEKIGEGGFGVVYKVIHHAKQRTEALKILFGKTPIRARYFENEVHLAAKLRHPNIATLYEAHLAAPPLYYSLEFVEGQQLNEYFKTHALSLAERLELVKTLVGAVGYAHQQGVVHRDIKPQNILIDESGQPRILDFGIAKKIGLEAEEATGFPASPEGVLGTFGYIAPEQIAGDVVDERADIYSLGALLYHCVTGEPASFANRAEHLARLLHERQVTRAEDLAAIIARCVQPLPEQRYATCAALVEDLDHYLAGRSIQARRDPTVAYRLMRSLAFVLRTRPLAARVLLVLLVTTALTLLAWRAEARWVVAGAEFPGTALIAFTPETRQAIADGRFAADLPGLDADDLKSWRLLYGRLLERLVEAKPAGIVLDQYFPDCQPKYDDGLIRGLRAMRAAHVPVIVGALRLDRNSEPEVCAQLLAEVHGYGTLAGVDPHARPDEWLVPSCIQRGEASPVPGLAVAAFAAARYPDADVDIQIEPQEVVLRYRQHVVSSGDVRWRTDRIPVKTVDRVQRNSLDGMLKSGDLVYQMQVPVADGNTAPPVSLDDVLSAKAERIRTWFHGRIVVIGRMLPGQDQYPTLAGPSIYGCEIHVRAIQALLAGTHSERLEKWALAGMVLLWSALASLAARALPRRHTLPLSALAWGCTGLFAAGVLVVVLSTWWLTGFWHVQILLALGTVLAAGSAAYVLETLRVRQMQLAPEASWSPAAESSTTRLAPLSDGGATNLESRVDGTVGP